MTLEPRFNFEVLILLQEHNQSIQITIEKKVSYTRLGTFVVIFFNF